MPGAILSIQSHVVFGHVGNSAAAFALQRLGHEVWPLHTVQFSSHAGHPGWKGRAFDAAFVDELMAGLQAISTLRDCRAVLTGYLGRPDIGEAALRAVQAVRETYPAAIYACDPVIGDEGKGVYVAAGVAEFFRDRALRESDIVTPNAFELEYLTGVAPISRDSTKAALRKLRGQGPQVAVATSLRWEDTPADAIDMAIGDSNGFWRVRTPRLPLAVNGAGDLLSALFLAHVLTNRDAAGALAKAASSVYGIVAAAHAAGSRELPLIAAQSEIVAPTSRFAPEAL